MAVSEVIDDELPRVAGSFRFGQVKRFSVLKPPNEAHEDWGQFGERKKKQLRNLQRLYAELGRPCQFRDMVRIGRINSSAELLRMTRQTRAELKARVPVGVEASVRIPRPLLRTEQLLSIPRLLWRSIAP